MEHLVKLLGLPKEYRNTTVSVDYYTPTFNYFRRDRDLVNILSPVYRLKKYRFLKDKSAIALRAEAIRAMKPYQRQSSTTTMLAPKLAGYFGTHDEHFKMPSGRAPKPRRMTADAAGSLVQLFSPNEKEEIYTTAFMQAMGANLSAKAGKRFKWSLQAIIPTDGGTSCIQKATLVHMHIPPETKPVKNSKLVVRKAPFRPEPNRLISFLPPRAQKVAEEGREYAFIWSNGQSWKNWTLRENEKPRYKFYTKKAMRFRFGKRLPAITEKNEDSQTLHLEQWTQYYQEGQRKRYLRQLEWDQMKPEGDAKIFDAETKAGHGGGARLPQCPFHTRLYCSRRHTWLLRDFRSCPLCSNTYTSL